MIRESHKYISLSLHNEFDSVPVKSIKLIFKELKMCIKTVYTGFIIYIKSINMNLYRLSCSYEEGGGERK
jgi:hypothetical protein